MLQSKAGYIDARPHIRPLDEVLLQRTAGPYIWVSRTIGQSIPAWNEALCAELRRTGPNYTDAVASAMPSRPNPLPL
jgi:hypothetical protein